MPEETLSPYGVPVPASWVAHETVSFSVKKGQAAGIRINPQLAVIRIDHGSVTENHLLFGDVIKSMNGTDLHPGGKPNRQLFIDVYKKFNQADFKCEFKLWRPKTTVPDDAKRYPDSDGEYKYRIAVMYLIQNAKLSLGLRSNGQKVFVSNTFEFTITGHALRQGDCILDVDKTAVASNKEATDKIMQILPNKGFVTLAIEYPETAQAKFAVRTQLNQSKAVEIDIMMPPDVMDICDRELARLKRDPNGKPKKEVLHASSHKQRENTSRLKVREESLDIPIVADLNPLILTNVPVAAIAANNYQTLSDMAKNEQQQK